MGISRLELLALSINPSSIPKYLYTKGVIRYKGRVFIGAVTELRRRLISIMHESAVGRHSGNLVTYQRMKTLFYWPGMKKEIEAFVQECEICKRNKVENCESPSILQPLQVPDKVGNTYQWIS